MGDTTIAEAYSLWGTIVGNVTAARAQSFTCADPFTAT